MYEVYCISAGQLDVKKDANVINKKNNYLNYGLLSLTSIIGEFGLTPIQLHGHFSEPRAFAEYCVQLGITQTKFPVFISIPSFYAISWVNKFTKILKYELKIKEIIIGGRWVIDGEITQLTQLLPYVDKIVDGLGENQVATLLNIKADRVSGYTPLNYNLVDKREFYQPGIEVSRGCGMKCDFCQERDEKLQPLKSALALTSEASHILLRDDLNPMSPYFEASIFKPSLQWLEELTEQRELHLQTYSWRAESRADNFTSKDISALSKAGMKVLDLGLESASPTQIKNMGKSKDPEKYLTRASRLLEEAHEAGIDVKVNVLLYAGETSKTIDETYKWLDQHRDYIKGVSVGPVLAFGWDNRKSNFIKTLESCGASVCQANSFTGVTGFNLSDSINYESSLQVSKELSRDFMTANDYFYLKSFSYFSRDYKYQDFLDDIQREKGSYSFDVK
ncbi:radical SAM protein [Vibrio cortegadensis]|uniref:Radical SAM protein n=1 Tax=Vibrio cortegadensis TaxID=1328770 RepID=A0ABV4MBJ6_9VIBR